MPLHKGCNHNFSAVIGVQEFTPVFVLPATDLDGCGKVKRVALSWVGKTLAIPLLLYFFICSLDFLASAFRLLGGKAAGKTTHV